MRQTIAFLKFVVAMSFFLVLSAHADGTGVSDAREAQSWLKKMQAAAQKLNYSGTFVYQQGNQMRTSRITHVLDGRNEYEKLEVLDGKPREYVRTNDEVICYVPESKTLLVEKRGVQDVFPAILAASPAELEGLYSIRKGEVGRVAGYDCQAILLEPRDNMRYGYRLWVERSSGLLLRAQTLNEKQEVIEQIAFTQIAIGDVDRARAKSSFTNTSGWKVENAVMSQAGPSGWTVKSLPAGFKKVREVKRVVTDSGATESVAPASLRSGQREVSQMVFSDGLAAISVFIEPGSQSRTEGSMQQGALNIVGKRQGDFWLTIVGEVPSTAIRQVANSIEFTSRQLK
ncbi:MAG TPA: MucB/RseB C-terminal domain-containing protein [Noviherbaspirillum sp.]|uniref:MucB/RseB C-terminal domain-containing protein n=1 Tax=Noviherbaspirillum sp. TaxID=1926288 RepID=UPI002D2E7029|nr:MucB/RseB C-terminal domain-containing protein [Noviherbaspirillum sp.]HYD97647.1 MucB/RseB C-terminal domain-containing protein [Noviherbaspirillum sp.]